MDTLILCAMRSASILYIRYNKGQCITPDILNEKKVALVARNVMTEVTV